MKRLLLALVFSLVSSVSAFAEPIAALNETGVQIMLYNDKCQMAAPTNLKYRAVWTERGKIFEGCFMVFLGLSVGAYFDDNTMAVMPVELFKPVQEI